LVTVFFSSRRRHTRFSRDWSSDVCSSDLDCLLLDEPTNHLDLESIMWLEGYLRNYPGSILLICHDRRFVDNVCEGVLDLRMGKEIGRASCRGRVQRGVGGACGERR